MMQYWGIEAVFGLVAVLTPIILIVALNRMANRCVRSRDSFESNFED